MDKRKQKRTRASHLDSLMIEFWRNVFSPCLVDFLPYTNKQYKFSDFYVICSDGKDSSLQRLVICEGLHYSLVGDVEDCIRSVRFIRNFIPDFDEQKIRDGHGALMEELAKEYPLSIDVNVLKHLGINLYSNVPAVLTEMVANAWDADAEEVSINIDVDGNKIIIHDAGHGMSYFDIKNKYLRVGYERRDDTGDLTPKGRPVMGRKGVGKLAPFSIANVVEVYSTKGDEKSALRMNAKDIEKSKGNYLAETLPIDECPEGAGTKIILKELKKERVRVENLVQRLARRFSVIGTEDFKVYVTRRGEQREVTSRDRGDLEKLQYLWVIGDWTPPSWVSVPEERIVRLSGRLDGWDPEWRVNGWIGTARKPKDLDGTAGNLNVIAVIARGRLFEENILWQVNDGRNYLSYVAGHIEADFLDKTELVDIATSDRQRVQEDDPRFRGLVDFVRSCLSKIEGQWSKWRVSDGKDSIRSRHPELDKWLEKMGSGHKKHAEKLLGNIMKYELEDEQREALLENAILGFERARLSGSTGELVENINAGSEKLIAILSDRDSLEASLYRNIIKNRLDVIKVLDAKVKQNELENSIRDYIFDHLWLIDPAWERASGSEYMETNVAREFENIDAGLTAEEKRGRVDLKYRHATGMHVIIELKRPERVMSVTEITQQGLKYRTALERFLASVGRSNEPIEVVFVLGKPLRESQDPNFQRLYDGQMNSVGGRCVYFNQLVDSALRSYAEYLEKSKELDEVEQVVNAIKRGGV